MNTKDVQMVSMTVAIGIASCGLLLGMTAADYPLFDIVAAGVLAMMAAGVAALFFALRRARRMQAMLQAMANDTSKGIAAFENGRLVAWNRQFVDLLRLAPTCAKVGMTASDLESAEPDGLLADLAELINRARTTNQSVTVERTGPDGTMFDLSYGPPQAGIVVFSVFDATVQRQSERFLRNAQKMDALGHLTEGIAHDFNNLLTVVMINLEVMREDPTVIGKFKKRMELMSDAAQRGTALVRQLLAYARKQPAAPEIVDLRDLMPGLGDLIRRTIGENIEVKIDVDRNLWPTILDAAQFESAVLNLALNARDAMPESGKLVLELANVTVDESDPACRSGVAAQDYVMLAASDTGCGMSTDVLARAFEPFFTTKEDGRWSGLGLSMVRGFLTQAAGYVTIDSRPGHGTTVKLFLPPFREEVIAGSAAGPGSASVPQGTETILVVEDDERLRTTAVGVLNNLGYDTLEASDGRSALRVLENGKRVDVLFTDIILSDSVNGRKLARAARELQPGIKILYTSGYAERPEQHAPSDPFVGLLNKPYRIEELATKLKAMLARPAA